MTEVRLFTPGPTSVPREILEETARPMIHHRSEEFRRMLVSCRGRLKDLCGTSGEVAILTASGTGGMEACAASLFSPGDEVVVVDAGKFGRRWAELAGPYELNADVIRVERGRAVKASDVLSRITADTRGLLIQSCESSTGARHPVEEIGEALKERDDILLVVDALTSLGAEDVAMDRNRIDVLVGASQKALMTPPGLAFVALGPRALRVLARKKARGFYLSLQRELTAQREGATAFTPAVSLVRGLDLALKRMEKEGREAVWARTLLMQRMVRAALRADGLELLNPDAEAAPGMTVALTPAGLDVKAWLADLKGEHGLWLAGGQGELEGKVFRMAHMGACQPGDVLWALEKIEASLEHMLPAAKDHAGLKAAEAMYRKRTER